MDCFRQTLTDNSYTRQVEMNFAGCDRYQRARVGTLLSLAAAVAGYDYDARGLTHEKLWDMREVFLLSRIALKIQDCPKVRDVLDVTTWEDGTKGAHMQRVYEMRDQAGALRAAIRSDWVLVDPQTRRISRPESFTAKKLTTCPVEIDCPPTRKVLLPRQGLEELGSRRVRWSDLDGNGHLYSGNYGDIIWDFLPTDLRERTPSAFYINYSREATLDQELRLLGQREGTDVYQMEALGPNGTCFTCRCEFSPVC